jgi:hypothetical protein
MSSTTRVYVYRLVMGGSNEAALWQWRNYLKRTRFLTRHGAVQRAAWLREKGIESVIERSEPVQWPESETPC